MKKLLLTLCLLLSISSFAIEDYSYKRCQIKYYINAQKDTDKIQLITTVPQSVANTQEIVSIDYSIKPHRIFKENKHQYAEFLIDNPERETVIILDFFIKIFPKDLKHRKKAPYVKDNFSAYLKAEKHIESDSERIQSIAQTLQSKSDVKTIKKIFKYVRNKFTYKAQNRSVGALKASYATTGDCSEYSDLFIALCRANGIPAKKVKGYTSPFGQGANLKGKQMILHAWAEAYLDNIGWVRFEPTRGYNSDYRITSNNYIQISSLRNKSIYKYRYKGGDIKVKMVFISS